MSGNPTEAGGSIAGGDVVGAGVVVAGGGVVGGGVVVAGGGVVGGGVVVAGGGVVGGGVVVAGGGVVGVDVVVVGGGVVGPGVVVTGVRVVVVVVVEVVVVVVVSLWQRSSMHWSPSQHVIPNAQGMFWPAQGSRHFPFVQIRPVQHVPPGPQSSSGSHRIPPHVSEPVSLTSHSSSPQLPRQEH
ncbi:MAG: hypothetical protein R2839_06385 [Thermomicrobiales bacterium]